MVVVDASVLIVLSKTGRLDLLKTLYGRVVIPVAVHREVVVEGQRLEKQGVGEIGAAIDTGWIQLAGVDQTADVKAEAYRTRGRIGRGEAEVIALSEHRGIPAILDDRAARHLATIVGIEFIGTAAVMLEARVKGHLDEDEFLEGLHELSRVMWLSPDVVTELIRRARRARSR